MKSMICSYTVERGIESRSGQFNEYEFHICFFSSPSARPGGKLVLDTPVDNIYFTQIEG